MADIWFEAGCGCCSGGGDHDIIDEPFMRRRFFFLAVKLSWPLSVFDSLSESELDESELDDDDDELELLELSDAKPVLSSKFTRVATSASRGSFSYKKNRIRLSASNLRAKDSFWRRHTFNTRNHFFDSFGRPRTVLCQTIGKFVLLQKFCVTAMVSSKLITTCHHPPGTKTVSPGFCRISSWKK